MPSDFSIVSLFTGCGGLDCGFHLFNQKYNPEIPFRVAWANDINFAACQTFATNFHLPLYTEAQPSFVRNPHVFCGDIRTVDFATYAKEADVDIVMGGFPCQTFSMVLCDESHGRKGICADLGKLYLQVIRAIAYLHPKMIVLENVPGLLSANNGSAITQIIRDFTYIQRDWKNIAERGSFAETVTPSIRAKYVFPFIDVVPFMLHGVPQIRKRLIFIGIRKDCYKLLQEKYTVETVIRSHLHPITWNSHYPLTPIEVFEAQPFHCLQTKYAQIMHDYDTLVQKFRDDPQNTAQTLYAKKWDTLRYDIVADFKKLHHLRKVYHTIDEYDEYDDSEVSEVQKVEGLHREFLCDLGYLQRVESSIYTDRTNDPLSNADDAIQRLDQIPPNGNRDLLENTELASKGQMSNVWRRLHPLLPAYTIIAKGGGGAWGYHYEKRKYRLTQREKARLQTFPDWFQFCGTEQEIKAQIGNAVPPLGARSIATIIHTLLSALESDPFIKT